MQLDLQRGTLATKTHAPTAASVAPSADPTPARANPVGAEDRARYVSGCGDVSLNLSQ